jgi:hypothetical protein
MRFLYKLLNKPIYRICKGNFSGNLEVYYVQRRGDYFGWEMVYIHDENKIGNTNNSATFCWVEFKSFFFTDELEVAERRILQLRKLDFKEKQEQNNKSGGVVLKEYGRYSEEEEKLKYLEKLK